MTLAYRAFFHEFLDEFEKEKKKIRVEKIFWDNKIWSAMMLGIKF